jgi:hypothetical protein
VVHRAVIAPFAHARRAAWQTRTDPHPGTLGLLDSIGEARKDLVHGDGTLVQQLQCRRLVRAARRHADVDAGDLRRNFEDGLASDGEHRGLWHALSLGSLQRHYRVIP